tara:strand:- start:255 stop:491 length:237 start_codon:yes stop_codon:yes gene_type:complete
MKTAISLPDKLHAAADAYASEHGLSRSALYAAAIEEYLAKHRYENLTEAINLAVRECGSMPDEVIEKAGKRQLRNLEW